MLDYKILLQSVLITVTVYTSAVVCQGPCGTRNLLANASVNYLTSPNYPNAYPVDLTCQWVIKSPQNQVVVLKLLDFQIMENFDRFCFLENVTIYDGENTNANMKPLCGHIDNTTTITSTGNSLTILFISALYWFNDRGFKFEYTAQDRQAACKSTTVLADETAKLISAPGNPDLYQNNMHCQWTILSSTSTKRIVLKLLEFDVEETKSCTSDYVTIYDGNSTRFPIMQTFCGQFANPTFTSSGSSMTVVFHSDFGVNYKAFTLEYSAREYFDPHNDVNLWANEQPQYIVFPTSSNTNNTDHEWYITSSLSTNVVKLKLMDFNPDNKSSCFNDFIHVYDGNRTFNNEISVACDAAIKTFSSSSTSMTIVFHTVSTNSKVSFKLQYTAQEMKNIYLTASKTIKTFSSPNYPNNYPRYFNVTWHITTSIPKNVIMLRALDFLIERQLESCYLAKNVVLVYDGDLTANYGRYTNCFNNSHSPITSTGPSMTVVFNADYTNSKRGFKYEYQSVDNSVLCNDKKILTSTNVTQTIYVPMNSMFYPNNMDCEWHIATAVATQVIKIDVEVLHIDHSPVSCNDYLDIYNGNSTTGNRLSHTCGSKFDGLHVTSTSRYVTVVFHSDASDRYSGFRVNYYSSKSGTAHLTASATFVFIMLQIWLIC